MDFQEDLRKKKQPRQFQDSGDLNAQLFQASKKNESISFFQQILEQKKQQQCGTEKKPKQKQHIIKREDGSILVVSYDQFNKLIQSSSESNNNTSSSNTTSSYPSLSSSRTSNESSSKEPNSEESLRQENQEGSIIRHQSEDFNHSNIHNIKGGILCTLDNDFHYEEQEGEHEEEDDINLLQIDSIMQQTQKIVDKPANPSTLGKHNGGNSFDLLMDNLNFQDERSRIVQKKEIEQLQQQVAKPSILKTPDKRQETKEKSSPEKFDMSADTFGKNSNPKKSGKKQTETPPSDTERDTLAVPQNLDDIPSQNNTTQENVGDGEEQASINGIQLVGVNRCLSFDEAMSRYSDNPYRPWGFQMLYQNLMFIFVCLSVISTNSIIYGMTWLVEQPLHFQCFKKDKFLEEVTLPKWLTEGNTINKISHWVDCSVTEICQADGPYMKDKSLFRAKDGEGLINWSQRFHLMCGNDQYTKYFGVAVVAGILFSLLFVPNIADKSGRKATFVYSLLLSLIVQFCLLLCENSMITLILLGLLGMTWPGKTLVGLMYILDFQPQRRQTFLSVLFVFVNALSIFFIPEFYNHISKDWYHLHMTGLIISFISLCYTILFLPESLWTLYSIPTKEDPLHFQKVRILMEGILRMNGLPDMRLLFRFDTESLNHHSRAIYQMRGSASSNGSGFGISFHSTQLETGSGGIQSQQVPIPTLQNDEENHLFTLATARSRSAAERQSETSDQNEQSHASFIVSLIRMTHIFMSYSLAVNTIQRQIVKPTLNNAETVAAIDVLGCLLGGITYAIRGTKQGITFLQVVALLTCFGYIYCYYYQPNAIDDIIFFLVLECLLSAGQVATLIACYCDTELFPREKRLSSIGFCHFMSIFWSHGVDLVVFKKILIIPYITDHLNQVFSKNPIFTISGILICAIFNSSTIGSPSKQDENQKFKEEEYEAEEKEKLLRA